MVIFLILLSFLHLLHCILLKEELSQIPLYYFLIREKKKPQKPKKRNGYHSNWSVVDSQSPSVCWAQCLWPDLHCLQSFRLVGDGHDGGLSLHPVKAHLLLCCPLGSSRYCKMTAPVSTAREGNAFLFSSLSYLYASFVDHVGEWENSPPHSPFVILAVLIIK